VDLVVASGEMEAFHESIEMLKRERKLHGVSGAWALLGRSHGP
jgi:hypothetical protein